MTPLVSRWAPRLVPCYNAARFLPRLHAAVGALAVPFSHVLCSNNSSRNDKVSVAQNFRLEIFSGQRNRGSGHARNQLAAATRTECIHLHDADDLIAPRFLERHAPGCAGHDVVSCDADWFKEDCRHLILA